jgi:hypothetical protein
LFWYANQYVRDLVFDAGVGPRLQVGQEEIDLGVADLDLVLHFALAQPVQQHLFPQLLAPGLEGDTIALQGGAKVGQAELVVLCHALHRAVELHLVDAQPGVPGELQLGLVDDQALEHLALEQGAIGQSRALSAQLALRAGDRVVELGGGDHVLVDHRNDAVDQGDALGRGGEGQQDSEEQQLSHLRTSGRTAGAAARSAGSAANPRDCSPSSPAPGA